MKKTCPSCFLKWEDQEEPQYLKKYMTCGFCRLSHSQEELIEWQLQQMENLNTEYLPKVYRHIFRFIMKKIEDLKDEEKK